MQALRVLGTRAALPSSDEAASWSSLELDVLDLTFHMTRNVAVPPELVERLKERLGDQQLVELVTTIGAYNGVSRVLVALGITAEGEEAAS